MPGSFASMRSGGPALGVDIGSRVVKMVLADQVADRIDIKAAGAFLLPAGVVEGGVIREPKVFGRHLAQQLAAWGVEPSSAVVSVPSTLAVLRWVSLPFLEGDELRDAARFKVKRHLPFPVETAYIEASPPEVDSDEEMGQSLVIAVRRDVIDSRAEGIEAAGLVPLGAELEAQAILRVVERRLNEKSALWHDASLTIIDVGGTFTHMYVVQNQRLQFLRGVKVGAQRFSQHVADELEIPTEEADELIGQPETMLTQEGVLQLQASGMPVRVNVQPELEKLTREFLRLLRYFRSLHPERSYAGILDHLLLCGGMAALPGFAEYLQEWLGLRVERARPFAGMVGKFDKDSFASIATRQEAYTVVTGLALSALGARIQQQGESSARREYSWSRSA